VTEKKFYLLLFFSQGEMPSPLLNLAAESGYCEFVTVLIDEGKVEVDTLGMQEIFFCFIFADHFFSMSMEEVDG
jgi:hypothetical protein